MAREHFLGRTLTDFDPPVRGDPITGERYYSKSWARAEWRNVFAKVWHIGGMLADPYTATTISFTRGPATSAKVQIDHIVPLSLAWNEGAWKWSEAQRQQFANDPMNLRAVDGPTNSGKGDKSISAWLPPSQSYHCSYVALYVAVHDKYDLAMSDADNAAASKLIAACE